MFTKSFKTITLMTVFTVVSVLLFAASGGKKGSKKNAATTSSAKTSMAKISLRSGYQFKSNKLFLISPKKDYTSISSYTTIEKGKKTILIANKQTISKPAVSMQGDNSSVQLKVKLRLN
jgi:hypothetical protein